MRVGQSCLLMALLLAAACSATSSGPTPDRVPAVVLKLAPAGWLIAEDAPGQVPEGTTGEIEDATIKGHAGGTWSLWGRETWSSLGATERVPGNARSLA